MNVFHCCTHKTASQWVRAIFSDPRVQEFSGLKPYYYEEAALAKYGVQKPSEKVFDKPFPDNTIITPLYVDYDSFCRARLMVQSQAFAFFVTRDPRDMLVSWYFSMKHSHQVITDDVLSIRNLLNSKSEKDGLRKSIHLLASFDLFESIRSWISASQKDQNIAIVKYEDLTSEENVEVFTNLFKKFGVDTPENTLKAVLEENKFEHLTGRRKGLQDLQAHLRKGIEGDWINFLDDELLKEFQSVVGDLSEKLGYKSKDDLTRQNLYFYQNLSSEIHSDLYAAKAELVSTKNELSSVKSELSLKQTQLEQANRDLLQTQEELATSREELATSRLVIKRKSAAIKRLKSRISDQEHELRQSKRNLRVLENKVKQIEASKLWKLKQFWSGLTGKSSGMPL